MESENGLCPKYVIQEMTDVEQILYDKIKMIKKWIYN